MRRVWAAGVLVAVRRAVHPRVTLVHPRKMVPATLFAVIQALEAEAFELGVAHWEMFARMDNH